MTKLSALFKTTSLICLLIISVETYLINHKSNDFDRFKRVLEIDAFLNDNEIEKCKICPDPMVCLPLIQCSVHLTEEVQLCDLTDGEKGCCCSRDKDSEKASSRSSSRFGSHSILSSLLAKAKRQLNVLMLENDATISSNDFMNGFSGNMEIFQKLNMALEELFILKNLVAERQINLDDIINQNINGALINSALGRQCSEIPNLCLNSKSNDNYRAINGLCNNPRNEHALWGTSTAPISRILPPSYEDGIWTPKTHTVLGNVLPNARTISASLLEDVDRPHAKLNLLFMQFGQFLTHDLIQTQSIKLSNGKEIACCKPDGSGPLSPEQSHFACLPISIDSRDNFYGRFGVRCMNFVRLSLAPSSPCAIGYGKQINEATHFLDGSAIYGSNEIDALQLRSFQGGRLVMSNNMGREYLPISNDKAGCPHSKTNFNMCYKAGDSRANTIISLVAVHTLFAREHNRVADILAQLNPVWNDEILYQESRRIVISELQHITYNEYLPLVIGERVMKRFRLQTKRNGYSVDYNVHVNPAVSSEFAGAAFRMGHSSVDGKFNLIRFNSLNHETLHIPDVMLNATRFKDMEFFDSLLATLLKQPMQNIDNSITHGLTNFLFRKHQQFGLDLAAFNIQRGRDLGIRSYNDYLELMGHKRIHSFEQFPREFSQKLAALYDTPDDIELWIGGLLEKPIPGGIVGTTFSEIIAEQFSRSKQGDRYFYENSPDINPGAFTLAQLKEIRKVSLARLICDNADFHTLYPVQLNAFVHADASWNPYVDCKSAKIPKINFSAWRNGYP